MFCPAYIYECHTCASYPQKPEENTESLGIREKYQCWELNSGPSKEQQMFLTAKLSLQIPHPQFFHATQSASLLSFKPFLFSLWTRPPWGGGLSIIWLIFISGLFLLFFSPASLVLNQPMPCHSALRVPAVLTYNAVLAGLPSGGLGRCKAVGHHVGKRESEERDGRS